MQSAKKHLSKALPAISMAAAAVLAAKSAQAQLVTPFYGNAAQANGALSNSTTTYTTNSVYLAPNAAGTAGAATQGITYENISGSAVQTITVPVGDYLFLAVDVVCSSNPNNPSDAGKFEGSTGADPGQTQPSYLGLADLGIQVLSSDTNAAHLAPLAGAQVSGHPSYAAGYGYSSKATLNTAGTKGQNVGNANPPGAWGAASSPGDVEYNYGSVGVVDQIGGGNTSVDAGTAAGVAALQWYSGTSNTYGQATPEFYKLSYSSVTNGTVTLTPQINLTATNYWTLTNANSAGGATTGSPVYTAVSVASSQVATMPVLVVKTGTASSLGHAVISLSVSTAVTGPTGYGSNQGTLTVTGGHGYYYTGNLALSTAQAQGYAVVNGFNPESDEEIYALDVEVGGSEATAAQINTLINAINGTDGNSSASPGVLAASYTFAGLDLAGPNPFPAALSATGFNLYLDMNAALLDVANGTNSFFAWDFTADSLLSGYTVDDVAAVPEPVSLGVLALGGVGLLARRSRRRT